MSPTAGLFRDQTDLSDCRFDPPINEECDEHNEPFLSMSNSREEL